MQQILNKVKVNKVKFTLFALLLLPLFLSCPLAHYLYLLSILETEQHAFDTSVNHCLLPV